VELHLEVEPKIEEFAGTMLEQARGINTLRVTAIDIDPELMKIIKAVLRGACVFVKATGPKTMIIRVAEDCGFQVTVEGVD
jgi:hypothetical protein